MIAQRKKFEAKKEQFDLNKKLKNLNKKFAESSVSNFSQISTGDGITDTNQSDNYRLRLFEK